MPQPGGCVCVVGGEGLDWCVSLPSKQARMAVAIASQIRRHRCPHTDILLRNPPPPPCPRQARGTICQAALTPGWRRKTANLMHTGQGEWLREALGDD